MEEPVNTDISMMEMEEPLLGSVTTFSTTEGTDIKGQQIRSSARVYKKMKLTLNQELVTEKIEKKEDNKQDTKKCYRPLWTSDDKTIFFEALNEFGKDFDKIHCYISNKLKKRGVPEHLIKSKDQVRHLYYRSCTKVSKYLKFAEGIKKVAQELYALINYGELRKKVGAVNEKSLVKLNELVYTGITKIKKRGKSIKVKTPMCRALRKLNQLDEKYDEIKLPNRVVVELRPKDMTSFLRVQSIAQNPRIRTTLLFVQKRLSSLISYLHKKWRSIDATFYEKSLISASTLTNDCVPPLKDIEDNKILLNPSLRLSPPVGCNVELPSINISDFFTTNSICLNSYSQRVGVTNNNCAAYTYSSFKLMNKTKKASRPRADSMSDKSPQKINSNTDDNEACDMTDVEPGTEGTKGTEDFEAIQSNLKQEPVQQELSVKLEKIEINEEIKSETKKKSNKVDSEKIKRIENIRKGWTLEESECLTLGEIYLMLGSDSKLTLEYSWDSLEIKEENHIKEEQELVTGTESEINVDINSKNNFLNENNNKKLNLSGSLTKLLSVAKLHYRKNIIECPCGHICGTKNNAQLKKAVESKIRKILTDFDKCTDESEDKAVPEENGRTFLAPSVYLAPKVRPISPANYYQPNHILVSQIDSIRRLTPRYCNRRGRTPRSKQVVVERKLPLLPNRVESDHQIVRMNIISQEPSKIAGFAEKTNQSNTVTGTDSSSTFVSKDQTLCATPVFLQESQGSGDLISKPGTSDITLELANDALIQTAPSSPSRILKESDDNQWINSEVADYSLSSLLGHLESPVKVGSSNMTNEDSRLSQDMGAQILSLLTETSMDFSANFADLAAQVTNDTKK